MNDIQVIEPAEESLTPALSPQPKKFPQSMKLWKRPRVRDIVLTLLPLGAFLLWFFSLPLIHVHIRDMSDLGLISIMPPATIIALGLMTISFCLSLQDTHLSQPRLLLHIALLIFMLYGITALVENEPRFSTVYTHIGYTEYIMRHGSVDPGLDTYFSWPTFFILGAFFTKVAGFQDAMSFVAWAPVFFNLIYFGPLYQILQSLTRNQRVIWLGTWLFYLANWIGQDYYSPQGMNIFLYLVIIAILLKWFKTAPREQHDLTPTRGVTTYPPTDDLQDVVTPLVGVRSPDHQPLNWWGKVRQWFAVSDTLISPANAWQKVGLFLILLGVSAFDISSHPLTPFFVLAAVIALAFFRRIPVWLPVPIVIMTAWWVLVMGRPFLAGHSSMVFSGFGLLSSIFASNVSDHAVGSPGHMFNAKMDEIMTLLVWGLAFLGGLRRLLHGYRDLTPILLAIVPFPLIVAQDYGGEMLLRIYLVSLPFMVFFVASLFYEPELRWPTGGINRVLTTLTLALQILFPMLTFFVGGLFHKRALRFGKPAPRVSARWITAGLLILLLVMQGLFLFARYGDERDHYVSTAEVNAIRYLYSIAPHGSILLRSWEGGPWHFQDYEYYDYHSLDDDDNLTIDIKTNNYQAIVQYVKQHHPPAAFMVFMRSTQDSFAATSGLPPDRLQEIEHELLASGSCKLIFQNQDTQILKFVL